MYSTTRKTVIQTPQATVHPQRMSVDAGQRHRRMG
jgi:hypothetical protein